MQRLVPDANVTYAHGQMSERELERIMGDFISGEIDVLVCTTIIETGMDISNANTIIIQDADAWGFLSCISCADAWAEAIALRMRI